MKNTIAIVAICITAVVIIAAAVIIIKGVDFNSEPALDNSNLNENIVDNNVNNNNNLENDDDEQNEYEYENDNHEQIDEEHDDEKQEENVEQSTTPSTEVVGQASTKTSPLKVGTWGIGSQYNSGNYVDIPVKVTKITRGSEAEKRVKEYTSSSSSFYKYTEPKSGMEWAVVDYTVDLTNGKEYSSLGRTIKMYSRVQGVGENSAIKYNNMMYIVSTMDMSERYSKTNIANGAFAVQLPIGCDEYVIMLGESNGSQAFFKGE